MLTKTGLVFAILIVTRLLLVMIVNTIPDMDPMYLDLAQRVFETPGRTPINLSLSYSLLLYLLVKVFGSFALATKLIYLVFSILTGVVLYYLTKELFNRNAALLAVAVFTFVPNFTFALVGYSHTVVVADFFLTVSLYGYWRILNFDTRLLIAAITAFSALLAALIRPELILYFLLFAAAHSLLLIFCRKTVKAGRLAVPLLVMIGIVGAGLSGNYLFNLSRSSSQSPSIFTDAEYPYSGYMHTLSMRAVKIIDNNLAIELGNQSFGTAEENKHSILRAIRKNPKEAVKNVLFNVKDFMDNLGHQLFMPVFLYLLIGVGLLVTDWNELWKKHLFLLASLVPCIIAVIIFHVEIRYLNPLAIIFSLWIALGLANTHPKILKPVIILVFTALAFLFITQAVYFSQNPIGEIKING